MRFWLCVRIANPAWVERFLGTASCPLTNVLLCWQPLVSWVEVCIHPPVDWVDNCTFIFMRVHISSSRESGVSNRRQHILVWKVDAVRKGRLCGFCCCPGSGRGQDMQGDGEYRERKRWGVASSEAVGGMQSILRNWQAFMENYVQASWIQRWTSQLTFCPLSAWAVWVSSHLKLSMPPQGQHLSPKQRPLSFTILSAAIRSSDYHQMEDVLTSKETLHKKKLVT